ncbi:MAG TPA: hypothetical protein PKW35_25760, partial [Nannocystaceae bacterium]|nr:hypothetical protein [Nannocystaceae bacterium]
LHRDAARLPEWAMLGALGLGVGAVVLKVYKAPGALTLTAVAVAGMALVAIWEARRSGRRSVAADGSDGTLPDHPWAYGPFGRFVVNAVVVYHITAVAAWCMPEKDCLSTFRTAAHRPFTAWLMTTQTNQGWNMFAPNPPRHNVFLRVVVTDQEGVRHDMKSDVYAAEQKPIPWVWNDRMRKMNRRMSGGESGNGDWYQKWHARYHCREWALQHDGVAPAKVELYKVSYRIPSPDEVAQRGWYVAEELLAKAGREVKLHVTDCARDPEAQLPDFIRARHGLPPLAAGAEKPWFKHRKRAWDARQERLSKTQSAKKEEK